MKIMKNLTSKQKKILIGVFIVLFIVGLGLGIFLGISSKKNESGKDNINSTNASITSENTTKETNNTKKALTLEMEELKNKIEQEKRIK